MLRWTRSVPPGGVGEVVLKQATKHRRHGRSTRSALLYSDDPGRPTLRLQMTGLVNTVIDRFPLFHTVPGRAGGTPKTIAVELAPASDLGYELRDVRVENDSVRVLDREALDERGRYRVRLELRPTDPSTRRIQVVLICGLDLADGRHREVRRLLSVKYVPLVEVSQETVYFRRQDPAEGAERSFRVMGTVEDVRFRVRDITFEGPDDESSEIFDVWWETEEADREYTVQVRRNEKGAGRKTVCKLVIHTDHPDEPTRVVKVLSLN